MKKCVYWISTASLAFIYLVGAAMYMSNIPMVQALFAKLDYPGYLVPILAVVKLFGAITILWRFNTALSDLAYAGMFYHLLLAISAHINAGDGGFLPALIGLMCLAISVITQNAARHHQSPYGQIPFLGGKA